MLKSFATYEAAEKAMIEAGEKISAASYPPESFGRVGSPGYVFSVRSAPYTFGDSAVTLRVEPAK